MRPTWKMAFRPLIETRLSEVRCVILGREPSIEPKAVPDGLAFSDSGPVSQLEDLPWQTKTLIRAWFLDPETKNCPPPRNFCLRNWAHQGVLLWNTLPISKVGHAIRMVGMGWDDVTLALLRACYAANPKTIFVIHAGLMPMYATFEGGASVMRPPSIPSFSGDNAEKFLTYHMFSKINAKLRGLGEVPINWSIK